MKIIRLRIAADYRSPLIYYIFSMYFLQRITCVGSDIPEKIDEEIELNLTN